MALRSTQRLVAIVAGVLAIGACKNGCKKPRSRVPPLCEFDIVSEQERKSKLLEPKVWLTVASPTVNPESMSREGPLQSACGQIHQPIDTDETFDCPGLNLTAERSGSDRVELTDLVLSEAGNDLVLLWAATDELADGEAEGTAAMALWGGKGLEIHAVGVLRGYRQAARMRLHQIGPTPVLLLEGDRCNSAAQCSRMIQVVPIINKRLKEVPVWETGRGCIGRAQFVLKKATERQVESGWMRRFSMTRTFELEEGGGVVITDQVNMEDYQAGNPEAPPRPFRKISSKRPLELTPTLDRFLLRDEDLWERSLRDFGSAQIDPNKGAQP